MVRDLIVKNRSYRRFYQSHKIEKTLLEDLIDLARLSPSAANLQRLRFKISNKELENEKIFSCLGWAGYLKDWNGPEDGERPAAYIIILSTEKKIEKVACDAGIASQSILLGAVESELRGCIFGSVKKEELRKLFKIPSALAICYVIALGKPKEIIKLENVENNDIEYWRDDNGMHHVPKRRLKDIII
ncbi:MAG: nitroreductase family protein [Candidatus Cloacimonetes bacterium]|jgi:nitroreductase|nr:nitroreductase family protein [Candidatus Cloacimonadota bacterium]